MNEITIPPRRSGKTQAGIDLVKQKVKLGHAVIVVGSCGTYLVDTPSKIKAWERWFLRRR